MTNLRNPCAASVAPLETNSKLICSFLANSARSFLAASSSPRAMAASIFCCISRLYAPNSCSDLACSRILFCSSALRPVSLVSRSCCRIYSSAPRCNSSWVCFCACPVRVCILRYPAIPLFMLSTLTPRFNNLSPVSPSRMPRLTLPNVCAPSSTVPLIAAKDCEFSFSNADNSPNSAMP